MGLVLGRARGAGGRAVAGLSGETVQRVWVAFNEVSESLALDKEVWTAMWWEVRDGLPSAQRGLQGAARKEDFARDLEEVFDVLDTDENGLVDALEALAVVCLMSVATPAFKARFVFTLYDFDAQQALALDEVTLLIKTTAAGLVKLSPETLTRPVESTAERLSQNTFRLANRASQSRISWEQFERFVLHQCPEIESWMNHFEVQSEATSLSSGNPVTQGPADAAWTRDEQRSSKSKKRTRTARTWEGSIVDLEPSREASTAGTRKVPDARLRLQRVLGMNVDVSPSSFGPTDDVLYACGQVAVVLDRVTKKQRFFFGHKQPVTCLDQGLWMQDKTVVASCARNEICVWDALEPGRTMARLSVGGFFASVDKLRLGGATNSRWLVVAGRPACEQQTGRLVAVYDWQAQQEPVFLARLAASSCAVSGIAFTGPGSDSFVVTARDVPFPVNFEGCVDTLDQLSWRRSEGVLTDGDPGLKRHQVGISAVVALCCDSLSPEEDEPDSPTGDVHQHQSLQSGKPSPWKTITGNISGDLFEWEGRSSNRTWLGAHDGEVAALATVRDVHLVSCGGMGDCKLKVWTIGLQALLHQVSFGAPLQSVHISLATSRALVDVQGVGLTHCDLDNNLGEAKGDETKSNSPEPQLQVVVPDLGGSTCGLIASDEALVVRHTQDGSFSKLGLACADTAGLEKTADLNSSRKRKSVSSSSNDGAAASCKALQFTSCGTLLALAQGAEVVIWRRKGPGKPFSKTSSISDFKNASPIALRFSTDDSLLAVVTSGGVAFVYDINELRFGTKIVDEHGEPKGGGSSSLSAVCRGKVNLDTTHSTSVLSPAGAMIDFSTDMKFMRINIVETAKAHFVALDSLQHVDDVASLKDQEWHTHSCVFSWGLHGAWPDLDQGDHIPTASCVVVAEGLGVLGFKSGCLGLVRWPCVYRRDQPHSLLEIQGHSKPIHQVVSCANGDQLVSRDAGGSIFVWKLEVGNAAMATDQVSVVADDFIKEPVLTRMLWPALEVSSTSKPAALPKWHEKLDRDTMALAAASTGSIPRSNLTAQLSRVIGISPVKDGVHYVFNFSTKRYELLFLCGKLVVGVHPDHPHKPQRIFQARQDLLCVDVLPSHERGYVVAGDMGGGIYVLDIATFGLVAQLDAGCGPVSAIKPSPSGSLVACVVGSDRNEIRVFDWAIGADEFSRRFYVGCQASTTLTWLDPESLVVGGIEQLAVLQGISSASSGVLTVCDDLCKGAAHLAHLWIASKRVLLVGDHLGTLHGLRCGESRLDTLFTQEQAHMKAISKLAPVQDADGNQIVLSAGMDGYLKYWEVSQAEVTLLRMIDTASFCPDAKSTPSLLGMSTSKYGVGDRSTRIAVHNALGEVLELDAESGKLCGASKAKSSLVQCHQSKACGVAAHPVDSDVACSVAKDKWLHVYKKGRVVLREELDAPGQCCAFSKDGRQLVVGMSGTFVCVFAVERKKDGAVFKLSALYDDGDTKSGKAPKGVLHVGFNGTGTQFFAACGQVVQLHNWDEKTSRFERGPVLEGHPKIALSVDYSADNKFLRTLDLLGNVTCFLAKSGKPEELSGKRLKKVEWMTPQSVFADQDVAGLYEGREGSEEESWLGVVACAVLARHHETLIFASPSQPGHVFFSPFPAPLRVPELAKSIPALACHPAGAEIRALAMSPDGSTLWSSDDSGCILEWVLHGALPLRRDEVVKFEGPSEDLDNRGAQEAPVEEDVEELEDAIVTAQFKQAQDWTAATKCIDWPRDKIHHDRVNIGEPVKQLPKLEAPAGQSGQRTGSPVSTLRLQHVFGSLVMGKGPFVSASGRVLSCGASVGISSELWSKSQLLTVPCQDERGVLLLDVDQRKRRIAAMATRQGFVQVWDGETGTCLAQFFALEGNRDSDPLSSAVGLAVSAEKLVVLVERGGSLFADVWGAPSARNWRGRPLKQATHAFGLVDPSSDCAWVQLTSSMTLVVGCGRRLWTNQNLASNSPAWKMHVLGGDTHAWVACTELERVVERRVQQVLLASTNCGNLIEFVNGAFERVHSDLCVDGAYITALCSANRTVVTGDSRGTLRVWDAHVNAILEAVHEINAASMAAHPPLQETIASVDVDPSASRLVLRFESGEVDVVSVQTGEVCRWESATCNLGGEAHLWSLAVNPASPELVVTAGDDGVLRVWDVEANIMARQGGHEDENLCPVRALAWSPDGLLIAAGYGTEDETAWKSKAGGFAIHNASTLDVLFQGRDSKLMITDAKFAPDGSQLALASLDGNVMLYDARNGFQLQHICAGKHPVIAVDYACETMFLRSLNAALEVSIFNTADGEGLEDPGKLATIRWATATCAVAWETQAFWDDFLHAGTEEERRAAVVEATDRSSSGVEDGVRLVAAASGDGSLRIANDPFVKNVGTNRVGVYRGHAGPVSKVRFAGQGKVVTCGARDCSVCVWATTEQV
ncbi:Echinoderm microtubule-associated protein-like 5 (EMAP-5) [Durusdinium trenchii]|uniref:Echinoderm microtubule-associated protein-like 5 (EMAP-5) n=1 Tax=Durusdinium trenchii TaxID=1381693 RepID=A0ABP0S8D4_9DINO